MYHLITRFRTCLTAGLPRTFKIGPPKTHPLLTTRSPHATQKWCISCQALNWKLKAVTRRRSDLLQVSWNQWNTWLLPAEAEDAAAQTRVSCLHHSCHVEQIQAWPRGRWRSLPAVTLTPSLWYGCCSSPATDAVYVIGGGRYNFHIFPCASSSHARGSCMARSGGHPGDLCRYLILSVQHVHSVLQCYRFLHCWESRKNWGLDVQKNRGRVIQIWFFWLSGLQHLMLQNNYVVHLCLTGCVTQRKFNRQIPPCGFSEWNGLFGSG